MNKIDPTQQYFHFVKTGYWKSFKNEKKKEQLINLLEKFKGSGKTITRKKIAKELNISYVYASKKIHELLKTGKIELVDSKDKRIKEYRFR